MAILVLGATGFVGRALVDALTRAGETVRPASRNRGAAPLAGWMHCDVAHPETLAPALEGVGCAYYLVHSIGRGAREYRERDRVGAKRFAEAAAAAGCRRIIYLGGVAPRGEASEHLKSRLEVGEILRNGRVPTIELRASMIVGNGSASWQVIRDLSARLPLMIVPRWLDSKTCPIALADVVTALSDARGVALDRSVWFELPGPQALSVREMIEIVARLMGKPVQIVRVPVLTPRLSAMWLKLVTGADYTLARELALGLTEDLLPIGASFASVTGHAPRWSFAAAAQQALESEAPPPPLARAEERVARALTPASRRSATR